MLQVDLVHIGHGWIFDLHKIACQGFPVNGDEIRRRREALGWTQSRLAKRLEVSVRTVSGWERNESVPRNRLGMLYQVFGIAAETDDTPDPLRSATDFALLSELMRRTLERGEQ